MTRPLIHVRRPLLLLAALAAAVALFAVGLAPATLADARVAGMTKGAVRVADAAGTIWDAHAILTAGPARIPIAWGIDAWPLLQRELHVHLVRSGGAAASPTADIAVRRDGVELRNLEATIPAAVFGAAAGSAATWLVGGDVEINAAQVEWAPPSNRGDARIRWRAARLTPPGSTEALDLGDITIALSGAGERMSGPVSNAGGDLAVRGDLALAASSGIQLSLVLTPRRADNRELARALSMLGRADGDGWRVEWRSPLR